MTDTNTDQAVAALAVAETARANLLRVLDLDEGMSWDDIVTYAAKTKGVVRMTLATVRRRTNMLLAMLGEPPSADPMAWTHGLEQVQQLRARDGWADLPTPADVAAEMSRQMAGSDTAARRESLIDTACRALDAIGTLREQGRSRTARAHEEDGR